ncbi:MAG: beta propeller repeat protein [Candidatus Dormibacteria bacterium]
MADRQRVVPTLVGLGTGLLLAAFTMAPVSAASPWWVPAPGPPSSVSAIASNTRLVTLAVAGGRSYWLNATTGALVPSGDRGPARFVAASGSRGLILNAGGELYFVGPRTRARLLQQLPGQPRGLAVSFGPHPVALAATAQGLFMGPLGSRLTKLKRTISPPGPLALAGPVVAGEPFVVATAAGILLVDAGGEARASKGSPRLGNHATVAETGAGIILAGNDGGLVYALYRTGWAPVFQLLPYGGLAGVPRLTAILGVGPDAAYIATSGFGTLLTPDGGYTWYRAAPQTPSGRVEALAALGPVYARQPSGLVVAVAPNGLFLHRLQTLPAAPVYTGANQAGRLLGTAGITLVAALAVVLGIWAVRRRRRRRLFV